MPIITDLPRAHVEGHGNVYLVRTLGHATLPGCFEAWETENRAGHMLVELFDDGSRELIGFIPGTMGSVMLRLGWLQNARAA